MSAINTGGPAFPAEEMIVESRLVKASQGMTLRDHFAAKADVGAYQPFETLRSKIGRSPTISELSEYIAQIRFIEADAMIAAREKGSAA